ncbi:MAG: COG2426 family protein [bacterium]
MSQSTEFLADEAIILLTSMLPVFELRGAILVAMAMGMPAGRAFFFAVVGSIVPAIPILLYLPPIAAFLRKTLLRPLINWALKRGLKRSKNIGSFQWWGLLLFVAIPIPSTGVWSGSIIASILGLNLRQALPPIIIGNMIAGLIVVTLVYHVPWTIL